MFEFDRELNVQLYKNSVKLCNSGLSIVEALSIDAVELNGGSSSRFQEKYGKNIVINTRSSADPNNQQIKNIKVTIPLSHVDLTEDDDEEATEEEITKSTAKNTNNNAIYSVLLKTNYIIDLGKEEIRRIRSNEFTNDKIIEYFTKKILLKGELESTQTFGCQIIQKLSENGTNFSRYSTQALFDDMTYINHRRTPYHCISDREFTFIPCNIKRMHWVMYIIYAPQKLDVDIPMILVVDSHQISATREALTNNMAVIDTIVKMEMASAEEQQQVPFKEIERRQVIRSRRGFYIMRIPQQEDSFSCGYFVLLYLKWFLCLKNNRDQFAKYIDRVFTDDEIDTNTVKMFKVMTQEKVDEFRKNTIQREIANMPD